MLPGDANADHLLRGGILQRYLDTLWGGQTVLHTNAKTTALAMTYGIEMPLVIAEETVIGAQSNVLDPDIGFAKEIHCLW